MDQKIEMKTSVAVKRILGYVKPYRFYLILSLVSTIFAVAASLLSPVLVGKAINCIVGEGNVDFSELLVYVYALLATVAVMGVSQFITKYATNCLAYLTIRGMRKDVFRKFAKVPLSYLDGNLRGDLLSRMSVDVEQISDGLLQGIQQLLNGVTTIIGTIGFMLAINVWIGLIVIVLTPLSLLLSSFIAKASHKMFRLRSETMGKLTSVVEEMVGNGKVVKAFRYEKRSEAVFDEVNEELYVYGFKAQFYSAISNPGTRFINSLIYAAVGVGGALFAIRGWMSVGDISSFLMYANQYTKPFNDITGVVTELQSAFASAKRVFAVMDAEEERDESQLPALTETDGSVSIRDVRFSYRPDQKLIENFNLEVKKGENVAIVGPTGCGKTTLINLLMRFYETDGGEILLNGTNVKTVTRDSVRTKYGMVLQDSWLFRGTVRDNISYGAPDAPLEAVKEAARMSYCDSFIEGLPDGYDTVIEEEGGNLSEGQKQLLCIARVMLTSPPMLILDEATSSIDALTELKIQKVFYKLMQDRTSFVVAHRLSTIRNADLILVMNNGNVIEQGSHEQLLEQDDGFYRALYNSQFD